jgi:undecaprenyl-diphosphatase
MIIKFLADYLLILMFVATVILVIVGAKKPKIKSLGIIAMAALIALSAARLMSFIHVDEARPFIEEGTRAGASYMNNPGFPSDHTLLAFTLAYALIFMTKFRRTGWAFFGLAIVVGLGRVLALVHTPLDVFGGLAAASFGAIWYLVYRKIIK